MDLWMHWTRSSSQEVTRHILPESEYLRRALILHSSSASSQVNYSVEVFRIFPRVKADQGLTNYSVCSFQEVFEKKSNHAPHTPPFLLLSHLVMHSASYPPYRLYSILESLSVLPHRDSHAKCNAARRKVWSKSGSNSVQLTGLDWPPPCAV
ncbi:hypothetical protein T310_2547 [Rasamsonia emersonii CBS 393.64]|uniref:Uncharacterized protein n=1 Tax=Rasamsonia emersonii (strain ATCC 16479 / CBS 393.64 / IMI 116815) TaxID=1408163 RepID=A0A0F4Z060_RASE3|nr:hypothetical protein T310_2547 [Rasamsonia emersonii CBS 393.64]KKA23481.1 hypothetical protein T310_2547 [Rasamsonia emersonii CBS 393.64]